MRLPAFIGIATLAFLAPLYAAQMSWTYDDDYTGQDDWGRLSPDYAACDLGRRQSPVRIGSTETASLAPLRFDYRNSSARIRRNNHTLEITVDGENMLMEGVQRYRLRQIQFHTPSEHTVGEKFYLMETHLIHEDDKGQKLIIAVFADIGNANLALASVLGRIPAEDESMEIRFNPSGLLPSKHGYYRYDGSLTMPPCTEGITWGVLKQPIQISHDQLKTMTAVTRRNARLEQPIYMRIISESRE